MEPQEITQTLSPNVAARIKHLKSQNPRQRSQAARELGELGAKAGVAELIEALDEDVNTYVRSAAAESLGRIGAPEAIFSLMDALHDPSSFVRRAAAISLGQMRAKEAQVALIQALDDSNFYVRRAAINAIGKLGIADLGPLLIPYLENCDPRIQRTTVTALRRLQTREALPRMTEMLEACQRNPAPRDLPLVKALVIALGEMQTATAIPTLIKVMQGYVGARSLAAAALGQIGDPVAGPVLTHALQDKSPSLQLAALKGLGQLRYRPAAPVIRGFLTDPDPRLRRMAARTLGQLQDREATPWLLQVAKEDPSPLVRPAAIAALGELGRNPDIIPDLIALVDDTNAYLRAALPTALKAVDGTSPEVQQALKRLRQDPVEHVAAAAQRACNLENHPIAPPEMEEPEASGSWLRRLLRRG